mgnify:FL=1
MPKLCFILPRYVSNDTTHFSHVHDLLTEISKSFNLFLIIENGSKPPQSLGYSMVYVSRMPSLLKFVELKMAIIYARILGYSDFYVHYSFRSAFLGSLVTRSFGGRTFYWNCGEPWKYKRNFLRERFERLVYKIIDFQVTGAPSLADQYSKYYGTSRGRIKIMPNWIDLKRFNLPKNDTAICEALKIPTGRKIALFIHHLSKRKGSDMILPVARKVTELYPEVYFIVVGDGPDYARLLGALKNDTSLSRFMRLEGEVPNSLIPKYLSCADVFFMPSEEEGFPRVLLESMAMGVPFVASDVGAGRDITPVLMSQYLIHTGDVRSFTEKLCELIAKNSDERKIISSGLKKEAAKYDLVIVAKRFREMITKTS